MKIANLSFTAGYSLLVILMVLWSKGALSANCDPTAPCYMLYDPVCGVDGRTYLNDCTASNACVEVDHKGACNQLPKVCQDIDGDGYSPVGGRCGPLDCNDRDPGINPDMGCFEIYEPVCGVDGKTYPNSCETLRVCVAIDYEGECKQPNECSDNDQDGYSPDGGECGPVDCNDQDPSINPGAPCLAVYAPVCGADGKTYGNSCEAERMCVEIEHEGACGGSMNDDIFTSIFRH